MAAAAITTAASAPAIPRTIGADSSKHHPGRRFRATYNRCMGQLSSEVVRLRPELIALRRDVHRHPELAYAETATAARIAGALERDGISVRTGIGGTGVLATLGSGAGRTVMLRVDMDGLPIQEQSEAEYASQVAGAMHACGHDGHVAMGVMAARILAGRTLAGTVRVLFQPAEEGEGGAQAMVAGGVMDGVDVTIGVHLWNELPVGTLGVKAGPLMAAVDRLKVVIHGRGGHGGRPQAAADPVVAAAHVVTALQTVVAREVNPVQAAVVTVGSIHGGEAFNVIPEDVTLTGTIRTFDAELRRSMPERIQRIASGVAQGLGCR